MLVLIIPSSYGLVVVYPCWGLSCFLDHIELGNLLTASGFLRAWDVQGFKVMIFTAMLTQKSLCKTCERMELGRL